MKTLSKARSPHFPAACLLAMGLTLLVACAEEPVPEPQPRPVRFAEVSRSGQAQARTLAGVVRSGVESRLSFRVAGSVEWLGISVGDRVDAGQVLARLDATDYELQVEEARAALAQAQANLRKVESDRERVRALYENKNASRSELDAVRAAYESARALVDARNKQLEQAGQQVGYTVLRAPADGAVASVTVEVNENVQPGQEICLLVSGGDPEVVTAVPEVMISAIRVGQKVTVELDALPGQTFAAEVSEVGVAVTGTATTFAVTARLLDWDLLIRSGMAADVTFQLVDPDGSDRIVVPGVAVGEDREGRFVYVLDGEPGGEATVHRRAVEVGRPRQSGIEVLEGLEVGELIVTAGVRRLTDGERVRVLAEQRSE